MVDTSRTHTFPAGRSLGSFHGASLGRDGPVLPALPCGTGAVTPPEQAMTGGSSLRRRRAEERSSAAGTESSSPRESAGGMGAGPALAALLLAGSVLSATLLAPGRRSEAGERPHGLGAVGTVRGPSRDCPTVPGAQDSSATPCPRWGGPQCWHHGSCDLGLASLVQL